MPRHFILLLIAALLLAGCTGSNSGGGSAGAPRTWLVTVTDANGTDSSHQVTRLDADDADHDGVTDINEYAQRSDPNDPDTDHDGLLDGHDVVLDANSSDALAWRAKGILESSPGHFLGEFDVKCADGRHLNPTKASSDTDTLSDGDELRGWMPARGGARVTSDPCRADGDGDGLPDDLERALGTDPTKADTDGDGTPDGQDADPAWNLEIAITNVTIHLDNGSRAARLALSFGARSGAASGDGGNVTIDVDDQGSRKSLPTSGVLSATDESGHPLGVFPDARGAIVTLDLLTGDSRDASGPVPGQHFSFRGAEGSVAFDWRTVRA